MIDLKPEVVCLYRGYCTYTRVCTVATHCVVICPLSRYQGYYVDIYLPHRRYWVDIMSAQ